MKHTSFISGIKLAAKAASLALVASVVAAPASAQALNGTYTIQQNASGQYLDAYEGVNDNNAVVRPQQSNNTQIWVFSHKGGNNYTIRQKSNGRYLDSYTAVGTSAFNGVNFPVVTRNQQNTPSQLWHVIKNADGSFSLRSVMNFFLEANVGHNDDAALLNVQANSSNQRWTLTKVDAIIAPPPPAPTPQLSGTFTIQQRSNMRYMDAHEGTHDNSVVTRPRQNNTTQYWIISPLGNNIYTIRQRSSLMYMDAHEGINDNDVVTRSAQNNNTQRWIIKEASGGTYTIRQLSNGRYLDAHDAANNDFRIVTRPKQNNTTQRWVIRP